MNQQKWQEEFEEASTTVEKWREKNKKASFTEIEKQLDEQMAQLRAKMLADLVAESELRDFKELPVAERPKCPSCGKVLASNGQQSREITTNHEEKVEIKRSKGYCRDCKVSYFPPR